MAVHSLKSVESLICACVKTFDFADIRFILFVPSSDLKGPRHFQTWMHRTQRKMVRLDPELFLNF